MDSIFISPFNKLSMSSKGKDKAVYVDDNQQLDEKLVFFAEFYELQDMMHDIAKLEAIHWICGHTFLDQYIKYLKTIDFNLEMP